VVEEAIKEAWPPELWVPAAEVAYLESGWNPRALLNTTGPDRPCGTPYTLPDGTRAYAEISKGLFQINVCVHEEPYPDAFFEPYENARKAYHIYLRQGWRAWYLSARKLGLI
jgi:hypothetical protein